MRLISTVGRHCAIPSPGTCRGSEILFVRDYRATYRGRYAGNNKDNNALVKIGLKGEF